MLHDVDMTKLLLHLEQLKAQQEIRNCINRYMEICDALDAHTDLNELMNLFDAECIWEGIGEKYAKTLGVMIHGKRFITCSKVTPNKNLILL